MSKYHEWYLCQISRTNHAIICLYFHPQGFVIFKCRYFKLSWNTTALSQWNCRNFSCSSVIACVQGLYTDLKALNRPLALRGHVTNASFKQWVGILLVPKIVRAHKNYLTPEIWEETHLSEIFYDTLIFRQSSMICIGRHVGGHAFALQHGCQNYFLLISCSTFHSYAQMCCRHYHIIFSTFPLKFKCKICVQRGVIHNF